MWKVKVATVTDLMNENDGGLPFRCLSCVTLIYMVKLPTQTMLKRYHNKRANSFMS